MPVDIDKEKIAHLADYCDRLTEYVVLKLAELSLPPRVERECRRVVAIQLIDGTRGQGA